LVEVTVNCKEENSEDFFRLLSQLRSRIRPLDNKTDREGVKIIIAME
jgi:hypothetical protein